MTIIDDEIRKLEERLSALKQTKAKLMTIDKFTLTTNTAYLSNMKYFESFSGFLDWVKFKHDGHWQGKNDSEIRVTFEIVGAEDDITK